MKPPEAMCVPPPLCRLSSSALLETAPKAIDAPQAIGRHPGIKRRKAVKVTGINRHGPPPQVLGWPEHTARRVDCGIDFCDAPALDVSGGARTTGNPAE